MARVAVSGMALGTACAAVPAPAQAGALRVTPIRVDVPPTSRMCTLTLANDEDRPVSVQVRGYRWSKDDNGQDILAEGEGIQVNPPILTLGPRESRLVRCALPAAASANRSAGSNVGGASTSTPGIEESWRLVVDELPAAGPSMQGVIQTLLRLSIPVFRTPEGARPDLFWSLVPATSGGHSLLVENRGTRHVKVLSLQLTGGAGATPAARIERSFYILPGGRESVLMTLPAAVGGSVAHPVSVRAETVDGPVELRPRVLAPTGARPVDGP